MKKLVFLLIFIFILISFNEKVLASSDILTTYYYDQNDVDKTITLVRYISNNPETIIPNTVLIDGINYTVKLSEENYIGSSIWGDRSYTLTSITFSSGFVFPENSSYLFSTLLKLTTLNLEGVNTSNVRDMNYMFYGCWSLTTLDLSSFDTSNVTNMSSMFLNCIELNKLDLSTFNTERVTDMSDMFFGCNSLTALDISSFDTSKVTNMSSMFRGCEKVTGLNLSNFRTPLVTNMRLMFYECKEATTINVSNFDTSKVTSMEWMFSNCNKVTGLNLSNFITSNVTDMRSMFAYCNLLTSLNISSFETSKVTNMSGMFYRCSSLKSLNLNNWKINNNLFDNELKDLSSLSEIYTPSLVNSSSNISLPKGNLYYKWYQETDGIVDYSNSYDTLNASPLNSKIVLRMESKLPVTGGSGYLKYNIFGLLLISIGLLYFVYRRIDKKIKNIFK